jgi:16S rRNA (adenine1518-N6/adenine1519-N6)-dimethyltransferase
MRRKTLRNALRHYCPDAALKQCGIDPGWRPEQLSVEAFVDLANALGIDENGRVAKLDG